MKRTEGELRQLRREALPRYRRELRRLPLSQIAWDLSCAVPDWIRAALVAEKQRRER